MVTIYWCNLNEQWLRAEPPTPILKNFLINKEDTGYNKCPAIIEGLKKVFSLKAPFSIDFTPTGGDSLTSTLADTDFINKSILVRSYKDRLYSINYKYILYSEDSSTEILYTPAYLEEDSFNNATTLVPGTFDIGKYFRTVDCAFHIKEGYDTVSIKEGTPFAYITVLTNKKVQFKQFIATPEILNIHEGVLSIKDNRCPMYRPLNWYYNIFNRKKLKKMLLNKIKGNLV